MPDGSTFDAFMALELTPGALGTDGGKWYEDEVFHIDDTAFAAYHKKFMIPATIDEYIAAQSEEVRPMLQQIRETIHAAAPEATEKISWQMPTFWQGENLIHFAAAKKHIGIYPGGEAVGVFAERLTGYKISKGAIQLPLGKPIDYKLIADIVRWRVKQTEC